MRKGVFRRCGNGGVRCGQDSAGLHGAIIIFNIMNIVMNIIVDPEFVTKSVKYFAESALNIPSCVNIETKFALKYFIQYPPRVA